MIEKFCPVCDEYPLPKDQDDRIALATAILAGTGMVVEDPKALWKLIRAYMRSHAADANPIRQGSSERTRELERQINEMIGLADRPEDEDPERVIVRAMLVSSKLRDIMGYERQSALLDAIAADVVQQQAGDGQDWSALRGALNTAIRQARWVIVPREVLEAGS